MRLQTHAWDQTTRYTRVDGERRGKIGQIHRGCDSPFVMGAEYKTFQTLLKAFRLEIALRGPSAQAISVRFYVEADIALRNSQGRR